MNKVQTLSKPLLFIFRLIYVCIPIVNVVYWVSISESMFNQLTLMTMPLDVVVLTPQSRIYACLVTALPMGLLAYIFYQLASIFKNYSSNIVFCLENAKRYKKIGISLFWLAAANFVADGVLSYILSYRPVENGFWSIGIGIGQVYPLLFGSAIYIISFIMEEAHYLEQDQKYII